VERALSLAIAVRTRRSAVRSIWQAKSGYLNDSADVVDVPILPLFPPFMSTARYRRVWLEPMDESLKHLRLLHNVLIITCAAMLGLALSVQDTSRDDAVIDGLNRLRSTLSWDKNEFESHKKTVVRSRTKLEQEFQTILREFEIDAGSASISDALDVSFDRTTASPLFDTMSAGIEGNSGRKQRTLREISQIFRDEQPARLAQPEDLSRDLQTAFTPFRALNARIESINRSNLFHGRNNQMVSFQFVLPPENRVELDRRIQMELDKSAAGQETRQDDVTRRIFTERRLAAGVLRTEVFAPVIWRTTPIPDETIGRWLTRKVESTPLATKQDIVQVLFPAAVRGAMHELGESTIADALEGIQTKRSEAKANQKVSLFGIDLRGEVALVLAPFTVFVLIVALFIHLKNLRPIGDEELLIIGAFPWIGLFPDLLSRLLSIASVLLAPSLAAGFLVYKLRTAAVAQTITGWAIVACIILVGAICAFGLRDVVTYAATGRSLRVAKSASVLSIASALSNCGPDGRP